MRRAFSLIELLIVIAIISVVGFLVFSSLKTSAIKKKPFTVENLKKQFSPTDDKELICIDKCTKCYTRVSGDAKLNEIKTDISALQAYIVDKDNNPSKADFGKLNDHKICLRFIHYPNGSSTQMIIESKGSFYYFPTYFGEVKKFDTLEEAAQEWTKGSKVLTDQGGYYR